MGICKTFNILLKTYNYCLIVLLVSWTQQKGSRIIKKLIVWQILVLQEQVSNLR